MGCWWFALGYFVYIHIAHICEVFFLLPNFVIKCSDSCFKYCIITENFSDYVVVPVNKDTLVLEGLSKGMPPSSTSSHFLNDCDIYRKVVDWYKKVEGGGWVTHMSGMLSFCGYSVMHHNTKNKKMDEPQGKGLEM